jgi:uncharacterized phiE125 gp8 family phage protein
VEWSFFVSTPPDKEPITPDDVFEHMREDGTDESAMVSGMISAWRLIGENHTRRAWMPQTITMVLDGFPDEIVLPRPKVRSVTSISYVDENGDTQTLSSSEYQADLNREPARIKPASGTSWPGTQDIYNAVTIVYEAGYESADHVPDPLKNWLKVRIATALENREEVITGTISSEIPRNYVDGLLDPFIVGWRF